MIDEIDEGLRNLLIDELPISGDEIEVAFEQPKREWSSRLSRPAINLFLYDVREDHNMRTAVPQLLPIYEDSVSVTEEHAPIWVKLSYMVTAWAADPQDEHRLLMRVLLAFFRHPYLDEQYLPGQDLTSLPILKAAQYNVIKDSDRIWSSLDNEMRPALSCNVSMPVHPFQPITTPVVRTRELGFGQSFAPATGILDVEDADFWSVGGRIISTEPLQSPRMVIEELGLEVPITPDGRFQIGRIRMGDYTVSFSDVERGPIQVDLTVPSDVYDIQV